MTPAEPFAGRTGKGVRVAVIDSGVNAGHPHIIGVAEGVAITGQIEESVYTDILGHGTAVMAAIQEKAPEAEYLAVRVFHSALRTSIDSLVRAIEWSLEQRAQVINLSLGTANPAHAARFAPLIERAAEQGAILVSASDANGVPALPGTLPGVIGVSLDWECPRETFHAKQITHAKQATHATQATHAKQATGGAEWYASGYPRDLPGMPRQRNLHGISFAVANMTGFVVRACEGSAETSYESVCSAMLAAAYQTFQGS